MKHNHRRQYQYEGVTKFAQIFFHLHKYNQKDLMLMSVTKKQEHKDLRYSFKRSWVNEFLQK